MKGDPMMKKTKEKVQRFVVIMTIVSAMLTLAMAFSVVSMNASAGFGSDMWNGAVEYGWVLAPLFFIFGLVLVLVFASDATDAGPMAKAAGIIIGAILLTVSAGIAYGVYAASEAGQVETGSDDVPTFKTLMNDSNETFVTAADENSFTWRIEYDTTNNTIMNNTQFNQFNFTVRRTDSLAVDAYFGAKVQNIAQETNSATSAKPEIIMTTSGLYDITWTDPDGGTANELMERVTITKEQNSATITCDVVLNSAFMEALWQNGKTTGTFEFLIAGNVYDCTVDLWNVYAT